MFTKLRDFLNEYLRINAMRRLLTLVEVRPGEGFGLVMFAVVFAIFEGAGLSLLLPILQYAESGRTAIEDGSGLVWVYLGKFMELMHLPVTLPVLLVMAFIPILLRNVVFYLNTWYSAIVSSRIGLRMRMKALDKVLLADPEFFARNPVGEIVGIVIGQTGVAGAAILAIVKQLSIVLLMGLYIAILLVISVPLTLSAVVFAALVALATRASMRRIRDYGLEVANISQDMMGKIVERFDMVRLIKLRAQSRAESKRIEDFSERMRLIGIKQARIGANVEVTADPLLMLSAFVTLYIGISTLGMTLAQLGLLLFVLTRLNAKVKEFNGGRQQISANMSGVILVERMMNDAAKSNTILPGPVPFEGLKKEIVFEDVAFEYPDTFAATGAQMGVGKKVLEGVSLTIPAGSFTALVGRSGAGKSTIVELLPRFRDVTRGRITYDGVDIKDFDVSSLRRSIGYLTQSAMLFNDTVRENLVYGLDHTPSEEEIHEALEAAYATFVYDLPEGLETRLGDRGVRFSGGERQRIGLARVLLQKNSILVLDEPTSALDSESEGYIQATLARLRGKVTIIVIAHRLATVVQADQLFVVDDGYIVERGTHAELVAARGAYQRLFDSQIFVQPADAGA